MALAKPKNIRKEIREELHDAGFPTIARMKCIRILERAVRHFRLYRGFLGQTILKPEDLESPRGKGRPDEGMLRALLISGLFRAWMEAFQEYPKINNKNYPLSPFVRFAMKIMEREGLGKIEDHLEEFRSYRKKLMIQSGFQVVRGKVI